MNFKITKYSGKRKQETAERAPKFGRALPPSDPHCKTAQETGNLDPHCKTTQETGYFVMESAQICRYETFQLGRFVQRFSIHKSIVCFVHILR